MRICGARLSLVASCSQGSILILVLWVLALLAFLAATHLARNREKAALCSNSWRAERENQAVKSVIEFFASDLSPISGKQEETQWIRLSPGGVELWVKMEREQGRLNINNASDASIRQKVMEILGEEEEMEGDRLADAILDWRDPDNLTRLSGAEAGYYEAKGLPYVPGNGPFQTLTELLLVRGMSPELFWGDPLASILSKEKETKETEEGEMAGPTPSFCDAITVFGENTRRLTVVIPGSGDSYRFMVAFMKKRGNRWHVFQIYRTMLISSHTQSEAEG